MGFTTTSPLPHKSIHPAESLEPGECFEPVIYEPHMKIKLSKSTYRVTSFTNFAPYLASFSNFYAYLPQFKAPLSDPEIWAQPGHWEVRKPRLIFRK